MKTEPTIRCDETTIEEMTARRDAIAAKRHDVLAKLSAARAALDDSKRDMREAGAGSRWGEKLTPLQISETKRIWRRAIDRVRMLEGEAALVASELKQANNDLAAALIARADARAMDVALQREEYRASKRAEKKATRRREHEERIIVLLVAARGVAGGSNPELWASRLRSAVESLAYCDTMIEGEAVEMPWGDVQ